MWVSQRDQKVRIVERKVVIASVPEYYVSLLLRFLEYGAVVLPLHKPRIPDDMRLVLLSLFDSGLMLVQILQGLKALHLLLHQVTIRHRMADHYDFLSTIF